MLTQNFQVANHQERATTQDLSGAVNSGSLAFLLKPRLLAFYL